jgi:hypothetical protein
MDTDHGTGMGDGAAFGVLSWDRFAAVVLAGTMPLAVAENMDCGFCGGAGAGVAASSDSQSTDTMDLELESSTGFRLAPAGCMRVRKGAGVVVADPPEARASIAGVPGGEPAVDGTAGMSRTGAAARCCAMAMKTPARERDPQAASAIRTRLPVVSCGLWR